MLIRKNWRFWGKRKGSRPHKEGRMFFSKVFQTDFPSFLYCWRKSATSETSRFNPYLYVCLINPFCPAQIFSGIPAGTDEEPSMKSSRPGGTACLKKTGWNRFASAEEQFVHCPTHNPMMSKSRYVPSSIFTAFFFRPSSTKPADWYNLRAGTFLSITCR